MTAPVEIFNFTFLRVLVLTCLLWCLQELECLQDHLEDLVSACRDVVGNLTELESEVVDESNSVWKECVKARLSSSGADSRLSTLSAAGHPDRRSAHQSL